MVLTEFNKELHESNIRAEERAEGRLETRQEDIKKIMKSLNIPAEQAMDILEIPYDERAMYREYLDV